MYKFAYIICLSSLQKGGGEIKNIYLCALYTNMPDICSDGMRSVRKSTTKILEVINNTPPSKYTFCLKVQNMLLYKINSLGEKINCYYVIKESKK